MLQRIEKQRVAEEIVVQLRNLILAGKYRPGEKLPPERTLARELGVNRASLREALKKLEHLGLVRIRQGDGTRVQDFMASAGLELLAHLMTQAEGGEGRAGLLRDVFEFRAVYAREVARLAAQRRDDDDLEQLRDIVRRGEDDSLSHEALLRQDFDFYVAVTQAAKNRVFALLINTTRRAFEPYLSAFAPAIVSPDAVRAHQQQLLRAIEKKHPQTAARVAAQHMERGALAVFQRLGLPASSS